MRGMPLLLRRRTRARLSTPGSPDSLGATCSSGGTRTGRPRGAGSPRLTRSGPPGRGCPADAGGSGDEPRLRAAWPRQAIRRHRGKGLHVRSALSPRERLRVGDRHRAGGGEEGRDPGCVTVVGVKGGGFHPRLTSSQPSGCHSHGTDSSTAAASSSRSVGAPTGSESSTPESEKTALESACRIGMSSVLVSAVRSCASPSWLQMPSAR